MKAGPANVGAVPIGQGSPNSSWARPQLLGHFDMFGLGGVMLKVDRQGPTRALVAAVVVSPSSPRGSKSVEHWHLHINADAVCLSCFGVARPLRTRNQCGGVG